MSTSNIEHVARLSSEIETALRAAGGIGIGMGQLAQSLDLPIDIQEKLRQLSSMRNTTIHRAVPLNDAAFTLFEDLASEVLEYLNDNTGRQVRPLPVAMTKEERLLHTQKAPVITRRTFSPDESQWPKQVQRRAKEWKSKHDLTPKPQLPQPAQPRPRLPPWVIVLALVILGLIAWRLL